MLFRSKLPENIVVSTVTWIDESDSDEGDSFGGDSLQKADSETPLNESDLTNASQHETWCLPMTAEGRGRDAEITLWDKKARQTITVTFTAATGELEIAR